MDKLKDIILKYQLGDFDINQLKDNLYPELNKFRGKNNNKNVVMYSYKVSKYDHVNSHEINRIEHSISSIRNFNKEIPIYLFCDNIDIIPEHFGTEYNTDIICMDSDGFDHNMLNAWSIHRWYNMKYFMDGNYNILYVDSDTIFYNDVNYLFDTYCSSDIYGREERGFRHCPITGSSKHIRLNLDLVDACIYASGGKGHVYKYCCGVLLLNNNLHKSIVSRLDELTEIMSNLKENKMLNPIPNIRILDQYAIWIMLSRIGAKCGLFGIQDVTHSYLETKHEEYLNPIILHYTTMDEQKFAKSDYRFNNLVRDVSEKGHEIDPYSVVA